MTSGERWVLAIGALVTIVIFISLVRSGTQWDAFAKAHDCREVSKHWWGKGYSRTYECTVDGAKVSITR